MEYIIFTLLLLVIVLALVIVRKNIVIKTLTTLDEINFNTKVSLRKKIDVQKEQYQDTIKELHDLESKYKRYFALLLTSPIKVYTKSNFYAIHSFFNGRYYAKINNKDKNNKAEGIPVIELPNSKNAVLNLYELSYAIKRNINGNIDDMLEDCTVLKEVLIGELHNKELKTYRR